MTVTDRNTALRQSAYLLARDIFLWSLPDQVHGMLPARKNSDFLVGRGSLLDKFDGSLVRRDAVRIPMNDIQRCRKVGSFVRDGFQAFQQGHAGGHPNTAVVATVIVRDLLNVSWIFADDVDDAFANCPLPQRRLLERCSNDFRRRLQVAFGGD